MNVNLNIKQKYGIAFTSGHHSRIFIPYFIYLQPFFMRQFVSVCDCNANNFMLPLLSEEKYY